MENVSNCSENRSYLEKTLHLINVIKIKGLEVDAVQHDFYCIEKDIRAKLLDTAPIYYGELIREKINDVRRKKDKKFLRLKIVFEDMVKGISESKSETQSKGIVALMIPVICEILREKE
jgi:hypothetical protein